MEACLCCYRETYTILYLLKTFLAQDGVAATTADGRFSNARQWRVLFLLILLQLIGVIIADYSPDVHCRIVPSFFEASKGYCRFVRLCEVVIQTLFLTGVCFMVGTLYRLGKDVGVKFSNPTISDK